MPETDLPIIAIVGRPNVGKSALFNRIVGRRIAIVHEESGVTRDRIAAPGSHGGRHFLVVDTGGLGVLVKQKKVHVFDGLIRSQVASVIEEAAAIVWVVDCQDGASPLDFEMAELLRESTQRTIVAVNKADNAGLRDAGLAEFAPLGFPQLLPISCTQNTGVDELLDACVPLLPDAPAPAAEGPGLRLAVVGRPNVGKSSLVNRLLGEERVIVSEIPGTTRDAVDVPFRIMDGDEEVPATLIDTAGLRRRRRVDSAVEFFSVTRAEKAIRRSDVTLLVLDAMTPGTAQDRRIARLITEARKPCILVVNKWDLVSGGLKQRDLERLLRDFVPFMDYAPIVFVCALSGYNMSVLIEGLLRLREQMQVMIPTAVLNRFLQDIVARTPPPSGAKPVKIFYATMTGNRPPRFLLFVNDKRICPGNYLQFLENRLRKAFFPGVGLPVWVQLRQRRQAKERTDGTRQAIGGVMREAGRKHAAKARHESRRKGWRKK